MRKTNKRGFTIVELVIVIAVIAILAAVLIPTFSNLVKKANRSADIQLVRNMNMALQVDGAAIKTYDTAYDALKAAAAAGYDLTKITTSDKENTILWDERNQCFTYKRADSDELEYVPNSRKDDTPTPDYQLWKVYTEAVANGEYDYSVYWNGGDTTETLSVKNVGFDAGDAVIGGITYTGDAGYNVVIRTNGGALTVNAPADDVKHCGWVEDLTVSAVRADHCYHEFGFVANLNPFGTGTFVAEEGAIFHQTQEEVAYALGGTVDLSKATFSQHSYGDNDRCYACGILNPAHVHTWEMTKNETDTQITFNFECTVCGETYTESIDKPSESGSLVHVEATAPTCTTVGNAEYWINSEGDLFADEAGNSKISAMSVILPATGHQAGEPVVSSTDATCTEAGAYTITVTCTVCDAKLSEKTFSTPALGHSYDEATHKCARCGENDPTYNPIIEKVDADGTLLANAFLNDTEITVAVIPEGVKVIGSNAFKGCTNLTSVTLPNSITTIQSDAFANSGIISITIPSSVTAVSSTAFAGCSDLIEIKVAEGNTTYTAKGNCLIKGGVLVLGCKASTIPTDGSVTSIGDNAFKSCSGLTSVSIPANIVSIGKNAFDSCLNLESVTFEEDSKITEIGEYAFYNSGITSITIPNSVTSMGQSVFYLCTSLQSATLSENIKIIPLGTFSGCSSLNNIIIPANVTEIGTSAFKNCSSLKNITIPKAVVTINSLAFDQCSELESVVFADITSSARWIAGTQNIFYADLSNASTMASYLTGNYFTVSWTRKIL